MSAPIAPSYLAVDVSPGASTALGHLPSLWAQTASELERLTARPADPHVGLVSFGSGIDQRMPLSAVEPTMRLPDLGPPATMVINAEDLAYLRDLLTHDLDWYKSAGHQVVRPVIYLITTSNPPHSDWMDGVDALLDPSFNYRPNILGLCADRSATQVAWALATSPPYIAESGVPSDDAFLAALEACFEMIRTTAITGSLTMPTSIPGFTRTGNGIDA